MKRVWGLIAFLTAALAVFPAQAHEPSWLDPVVGDGYGVQIKEGRTGDDELKMIREAGLSYVRFVIPWYEVEKEKGEYDWGTFSPFIERLRAQGLKAVIVLGGGHPAYTGEMKAPENNIDHIETYVLAPATQEARDAFASFAARTVEHFEGDDIVWELWNEPDQDRFWAPKAKVEDYVLMAEQTCQAIRELVPLAKIIGPGMADTPGRWGAVRPGFLGTVLRSPVAECLDAISVHPYRDMEKPPETVEPAYRKLRAFIEAFLPEKAKRLPILATEWGFSLVDNTEEEQAAFLLRSFLLNSLNRVPLSIWYEWRDSREGEGDPEAHFGLLRLDRTPKAAYRVLRDFLLPLKGARVEKRLENGFEKDYLLILKTPQDQFFLVGWTAEMKMHRQIDYQCGPTGQRAVMTLGAIPQKAACRGEKPKIIEVRRKHD